MGRRELPGQAHHYRRAPQQRSPEQVQEGPADQTLALGVGDFKILGDAVDPHDPGHDGLAAVLLAGGQEPTRGLGDEQEEGQDWQEGQGHELGRRSEDCCKTRLGLTSWRWKASGRR